MSLHLLECAAEGEQTKDLPPAWKLALMAFGDSADKHTHIAYPGLERVMTWSGLSRSRTFEVVNELERLGLLQKHRGGRAGRRAEYVVFPRGCCQLHPKLVEDDEPAGSDGPDPVSLGGSDGPDSAAAHGLGSDGPDPLGSDGPDSVSVPGSDGPDPERSSADPGSDGPDPLSVPGSGQGPAHRTPSPASAGEQVVGEVTDRNARRDPTPEPDPTEPTPSAGPADRDDHGPLSPNCRRHPSGTDQPCGPCATRREAFERAERSRAAVRRRAEQDAAIQAARRERSQASSPDVRATRAAEARKLLASVRGSH